MTKREIEERGDDLIGEMVAVNHVTKVVKGGRTMAFSALAVVGDGDGRIGIGKDGSKEVLVAIQKTVDQAYRSIIEVPLKNGITHYGVIGCHGVTKVFMQPAKESGGAKADGLVRLVFDAMGIHNISAKVHGSIGPHNIVHATLDSLSKLYTPTDIAAKRGLTVEDILRANHDWAKKD